MALARSILPTARRKPLCRRRLIPCSRPTGPTVSCATSREPTRNSCPGPTTTGTVSASVTFWSVLRMPYSIGSSLDSLEVLTFFLLTWPDNRFHGGPNFQRLHAWVIRDWSNNEFFCPKNKKCFSIKAGEAF